VPVDQYVAHHNNQEIRVENTWFAGARLYIDDRLMDRTSAFTVFKKRIVLRARLSNQEDAPTIEVMARSGLIRVFFQLLVDDKEIAFAHA